jgi:hypothetical protein
MKKGPDLSGPFSMKWRKKTMILLIIIILIIAFLFWAAHPKEGKVVLLFANIGAGKTTLLARYAKKAQKQIKRGKAEYDTIVSNTPIAGCIYIPKIREFLRQYYPRRTLFLIDEGELVWNNRRMKITDEEVEYIKLIRHYDSKMIIVSQSCDDIDIIIRRIYTNLNLLVKFMGLTLIKPIKKFVTIDEITQQIIDAYKFRIIFSWSLMLRCRYYDMFDTKWMPENDKVHPNFEEFKMIPANEKVSKKSIKKENE